MAICCSSCLTLVFGFVLFFFYCFIKVVTCDVSVLGFGAVGGGTATSNIDYSVVYPKGGDATLSTVTFAVGETNSSLAIQVINEFPVLYESPDETINFKILTCSGASINVEATEAELTVVDDGDAGTVQLGQAVFRPSEGDGVVTFPVSRLSSSGSNNASFCCSGVVQVTYRTVDGTATLANADYSVSEGTLLFNDQETTKDISVEIKNDLVIEIPDEYFTLELTSVDLGGIMGTPQTSQVFVIDDGDASTVQFVETSSSIVEGHVQTTLRIERSGNMDKLLNFTWSTVNGTASEGSDYVLVETGYAWTGPNVNETSIVVTLLQDDYYEGLYENFSVVLHGFTEAKAATEAVIGVKNTHVIDILDDLDVTIEFQNTTISEVECDCSIAVTMTRLSAPTNHRAAHFGITFNDNLGTATESGGTPDFTVPVNTFVLTNETVQVFNVMFHQNIIFNDPSKFMVGQIGPTTNSSDTIVSVSERSTIKIVILDDGDAGVISLLSESFSVSENSDFATITLVRTGGTSGVATVEVQTKEVIQIPASVEGGGYCGYWQYMGCTTTCNVTVVSRWDLQPEATVLTSMFEYCTLAKTGNLASYGDSDYDAATQARSECFGTLITDDALSTLQCGVTPHNEVGLVGVAPTVTDARGALASTGRCTSGTDYVPQTKSVVVFPSGQPQVTHRISLRVDNIYEAVDEKFAVIIQNTNPPAVVLGNYTLALFQIEDDGDANIVFMNNSIEVKEDQSEALLMVKRYIRNVSLETIVGYRLNRETASCCVDDVATGATITILTGTDHQWIHIPVTNDLIYQPPPQNLKIYLETVYGSQYTLVPDLPQQTLGLIDDGDSGTIGFDRENYYVNESTQYLTVTVVRQGTNSHTANIKVLTTTSRDGGTLLATASTPNDYSSLVRTMVLPETNNPRVNYSTYPVVVTIVDDFQMEDPDEFFFIQITDIGAGMQEDILTANITILEEGNDIGIQFVAESFYVKEDADYATITLTRKAKTPLPISQLGEISCMYKVVSDGITQNQNGADPDFQDQATFKKVDFHDDFAVNYDGSQTLIGQKAEFQIQIFNDTIYDQDEIIIISIKNVVGAILQTYDGNPCPMIAGEFVCTTVLIIKDDSDAGEIVFLNHVARTVHSNNPPPYATAASAGNMYTHANSILKEDRSSIDGSQEKEVLMIFNSPMLEEEGGYVKSVQVKIKHGSIGTEKDLLDVAAWPYAKNPLPKWHALVYERVLKNGDANDDGSGFRLISSQPIQPVATYERQTIEIDPPLRIEKGHYLGISIDQMNTCYGREIDGTIKLCSKLIRNQDATSNVRQGGRDFNSIDMQGLSISTHEGTCCGSTAEIETDQYAWVERSGWPKSCSSSGADGGSEPCPCASRPNNHPDGSVNWLRNDTSTSLEQGSCSREGISANDIHATCLDQTTASSFYECCTMVNSTDDFFASSSNTGGEVLFSNNGYYVNTGFESNQDPKSWCKGTWTMSRSPKLEKFRKIGLTSPQQCYTSSTHTDNSYSCHDFSPYCSFGDNGNDSNDQLQNFTLVQCENASGLYNHQISASSSSAAAMESSWGSAVYYHSDQFVNEILPFHLLNSETWELPSQQKENQFHPRQYDIYFDVDVAPALIEGTSLNMTFGREGVGTSMNVIAYVKQQTTQSKIAQQTGGKEATQGVDWEWKENRDLIQIESATRTAVAPLTFDTGAHCDVTYSTTESNGNVTVTTLPPSLQYGYTSTTPSGTCEYPKLNDNNFEIQNETATLAIVDALFADIGVAGSTFLTIKDDCDHGFIEFSSSNISIIENIGNKANITIVRRRGVVGSCRVLISSTDATAIAPEDYVKYEQNITLKDGENYTTFNVTFTDDPNFEYPNEYFLLTITEAEVTVNGSSMFMKMEESTIPTIKVYLVDDGDAGQIGFKYPQYTFAETGTVMLVLLLLLSNFRFCSVQHV